MKTHTASEDAPLGVSGRMAAYFQSSQLTPLLALVAFFLGVVAIWVTPREEEPQIDVTMATVQLPFPGAGVRDVEALVAIPAEQVLSQMVGVEHVYSVARPGMAIITVQFEVGVPREQALVRLHDTLITHRNALGPPGLVLEPIITPKGIDDVPVVSLTLWRPDSTQGAESLARIAHALELELKRVSGTRAVQTLGAPAHDLRVELDADRLAAFDLTSLEVRAALSRANGVLPAGELVRGNFSTTVEAGTHLESAEDVRALVVGRFNGHWVHMSDVARVRTEPAPPEHMVWFSTGPAAGAQGIAVRGEYPAVTLQITKKPGVNAADVARRIGQRVNELRNTLIPADVQVTLTRDYGATAQDKAQQLIKKLLFATLSVVALVFLALGRREALIVGVAVILTLATTLFASWAWGFTLNRVSLFALIFSIGILVDDAIVVVENIHRHQGLSGASGLAALIPRAVDEVGGPTILATLTVIAALLPMAFVSGLMGPYMSPIPINASMGMGLSLVIAFTLTPWLARKFLKAGTHTAQTSESWLAQMATAALRPFIMGAGAARKRWALGGVVLLAIALSVLLVGMQGVILKMLPFDNKSEVQVVLDMPAGTPVETTAAALQALGAYLATVPEVAHYQSYAGTAAPISFNGLVRQYDLRAAPELGDIQVSLIDKHQRVRKSHAIAQALRAPLEAIAARWHADVKVVEVPPGPPVLSPIVAEIYGPDESSRVQAAGRVRQALEATDGIVGVDDSIETPAARWVLRVDERKAAAAGLDEQAIVQTLQTGLAASAVTHLWDHQSKYAVPIRVGLAPELAGDLSALLKLTVRSAAGARVPLSEVVSAVKKERESPRFRKDLLPVVYVIADEAGDTDSPLYGLFAAREQLKRSGEPIYEYFTHPPSDPYRQLALKWDGEWQITYETFRDMGLAYAVGLILIYLLVVAQFRSYTVPLIIMAPIALTVIGVMPGHALLGAHFTATSMIGMIALAGIIVRNSILLVDFIQLKQREGVALAEAVMQAVAARAKPIVLTALAAMLGALFILDDPIFNGLAIALIFGIAVSTLLTLVVIPVLYFSAYQANIGPAA